ncbi:MAG: ornithine--oxo-acid transaminase [Gammaproteobacteria bacterium]|nr:ornithine--oxo-acid transaminase [Gammaproteobacteria bacterium]MCW5583442.1 ornithine--oxo-acid transaminase [Gammaproteobacteria bacterium]
MLNPIIERECLYGAKNYDPLPVVLVRGEGVNVWDDAGNCYIDMMSAYSAVSHGHCHPKLVRVLQEQATKLNIVSRAFYTDQLGLFLKRACELTGFEKALPMNTGAEAVETALKAARKWAYTVKGVVNNQAEIIACNGNFHGRTITIVGLSTEPQYRAGFGPFPAGIKVIPYGDAAELEKAITPNTAVFLVEPIQGEGGIIVPPTGYLKACAEICKKHNVLMICDEIQTGLGRTGKLLAYQHEGIQPDGVVLGKALGGGLLPVSLFLSRKEVMRVFTPGDHGSTFGGNPLAAVVGSAALEVLIDDKLMDRAEKLGSYFQKQLKQIHSKLIKEVRGKGLLIGLEMHEQYAAHDICLKLLKRGVLTKETHRTVIRFAPPLIITEEQIDLAVNALKQVLVETEQGQ